MPESAPERANFERLVVEPIENGYLVIKTTGNDELMFSFKSFRQVLQFLRTIDYDA